MHSGVLILGWVGVVGLLQFVPLDGLAVVVALLLICAMGLAPARMRRLIRRIRLLLLAIVVLFAGFTPGEALLMQWPTLSPSREGVLLALEHGGRLLAVVCCVAILLERLPTDRLISGLYALSRPLVVFGLSAERVAVRMLLVLRHVESQGERGWREWLGQGDETSSAGATEVLHLQREQLRARDLLAVLAVVVALLFYVIR
jgi:energy-coupling factor transporter transmembrane protein EcfT